MTDFSKLRKALSSKKFIKEDIDKFLSKDDLDSPSKELGLFSSYEYNQRYWDNFGNTWKETLPLKKEIKEQEKGLEYNCESSTVKIEVPQFEKQLDNELTPFQLRIKRDGLSLGTWFFQTDQTLKEKDPKDGIFEIGYQMEPTEMLNFITIHQKFYIEWTPLQYAVASGSIEAVKYLLEKNVNYEVKDKTGRNVLKIAHYFKHKDIISILKSIIFKESESDEPLFKKIKLEDISTPIFAKKSKYRKTKVHKLTNEEKDYVFENGNLNTNGMFEDRIRFLQSVKEDFQDEDLTKEDLLNDLHSLNDSLENEKLTPKIKERVIKTIENIKKTIQEFEKIKFE